jgi:GNAT superfamily N-acetyltransferase
MHAPLTPCTIRRLDAPTDADIDALAGVLLDCVAGGASVGFMQPLDRAHAVAFWRGVADDVYAGRRILLVAQEGENIVGTVHLVLAQPDNQPHRADLCKMLVLGTQRKRGIGAALLTAAEEAAREAGKTLLVLDTSSAEAERLYARMGWHRVGAIPGFALWPQGGACSTTYFYRQLA